MQTQPSVISLTPRKRGCARRWRVHRWKREVPASSPAHAGARGQGLGLGALAPQPGRGRRAGLGDEPRAPSGAEAGAGLTHQPLPRRLTGLPTGTTLNGHLPEARLSWGGSPGASACPSAPRPLDSLRPEEGKEARWFGAGWGFDRRGISELRAGPLETVSLARPRPPGMRPEVRDRLLRGRRVPLGAGSAPRAPGTRSCSRDTVGPGPPGRAAPLAARGRRR